MDEKTPKSKLKKIYIEILNGASFIKDPLMGDLYVKHLDSFDTEEIDEKREEYKEKALSKGLPGREKREEEIIKEGDWTEEKNVKMRDLEDYVRGMQRTKEKLILQSEIKRFDTQIKDASDKHGVLSNEKESLMGYTAEEYSNKKVNDFYIFFTLFKDKEFKQRRLTQEELDEVSDDDLWRITRMYGACLKKFNENNLKRIALSPFFLNAYSLCEDNPFTFFGKSIVNLTYHQTDLFSFGRYFKHILSEMKHQPTPEQLDDPDSLMGGHTIAKNSEKAFSKSKEGGATSIVGATKEDLKALGVSEAKGDVIDLGKEAAKKGGTLSMQDLIKMHGF